MAATRSVRDFISVEERKQRLFVILVNGVLWLLLLGVCAMIWPIFAVLAVWFINWLMADYNVRKLQALGTTVSESQFPSVHASLLAMCKELGVSRPPKVIVIAQSQINALAVKFAQKKIIVLYSSALEGIIGDAGETSFLLGHELCHLQLDHGPRGWFELYKPMAYKAARELTCDNCGTHFAGNVTAAKTALKRLCVGNQLIDLLNEDYLLSESKFLYSGLTGWLLKQYLSHPPIGKRIENVNRLTSTYGTGLETDPLADQSALPNAG